MRRRFHGSRGYEVISIPVFICIFVKRGQNHPCLQAESKTMRVDSMMLGKEAQAGTSGFLRADFNGLFGDLLCLSHKRTGEDADGNLMGPALHGHNSTAGLRANSWSPYWTSDARLLGTI
jgi:hypothetical protein